jgi:hypothetical protein
MVRWIEELRQVAKSGPTLEKRLRDFHAYRINGAIGRLMGPKDCRGSLDDPMAALRRYGARGVVVDVPLWRCRTLGPLGFVPSEKAAHPYVLTVKAHIEGTLKKGNGSPLERYYRAVQPKTAAELLGLPTGSILDRFPAIEADLPWMAAPGPQMRRKRARLMAADSAEAGRPLTLADGWNNIGPVSPAKAALETTRLVRVTDSIREQGYRVASLSQHVLGFVLRRGDDFAVIIWGGEHRVPALAALGYESVPLLLLPYRVANHEEADSWPAVRAGIMTRDQACAVCDRLLAGELPDTVARNWC